MERAKPGFLVFIFIPLFLDRALLCSCGYPGAHCIGQASLKVAASLPHSPVYWAYMCAHNAQLLVLILNW